ncbi:hypothetical protein ACLOJK_028098 [Asimina triloba]
MVEAEEKANEISILAKEVSLKMDGITRIQCISTKKGLAMERNKADGKGDGERAGRGRERGKEMREGDGERWRALIDGTTGWEGLYVKFLMYYSILDPTLRIEHT